MEVLNECRETGTLRGSAPLNQMRRMQLAASGGGACGRECRGDQVTRAWSKGDWPTKAETVATRVALKSGLV